MGLENVELGLALVGIKEDKETPIEVGGVSLIVGLSDRSYTFPLMCSRINCSRYNLQLCRFVNLQLLLAFYGSRTNSEIKNTRLTGLFIPYRSRKLPPLATCPSSACVKVKQGIVVQRSAARTIQSDLFFWFI